MSNHSNHVALDITNDISPQVPSANPSDIPFETVEHPPGHPIDQTHYLKGNTTITDRFYFEVTLHRKDHDSPGSVWLEFVRGPWFLLSAADRLSETGLRGSGTWGYEATTGSLTYENTLYAQDRSLATGDITVGFGVERLQDDHWSVFYMNHEGQGKGGCRNSVCSTIEACRISSHHFVVCMPMSAFITAGPLPEDLYPIIRYERPDQKFEFQTKSFKHKNCRPIRIPHRMPVVLNAPSPDGRHVACYSADDGILSLWQLDNSQLSKLVRHTVIDDMGIVPTSDEADRYQSEQLSIVVSNTESGKLRVVMSRYYKNLNEKDWRILFLEFTDTDFRKWHLRNSCRSKVAGHVSLLDDSNTLLFVDVRHLFVMDMKSQSLLRKFDIRELDFIGNIRTIGRHGVQAVSSEQSLKPFGSDHFLWHGIPGLVSLWHASTGCLTQIFRMTLQDGEKYDHNKLHNLAAFYGGLGLRVFTTQTGMLLSEGAVPSGFRLQIAGVKFVTIGDDIRILTIEGDEREYIVRVWDPLTGQMIVNCEAKRHYLPFKFKNSFLRVGGADALSISVVAQLTCTITQLPIEDLFPMIPTEAQMENLDAILKNPPEDLPFVGEKSSEPVNPSRQIEIIKVPIDDSLIQHRVRIRLGPRFVMFPPEPWNQDIPACHWLSEDLFMVIGKQTVQILNVRESSRKGLAIKHVWCVPWMTANITGIKLATTNNANSRWKYRVKYEHKGELYDKTIDFDSTHFSMSPKYAAQYIEFAHHYPDNMPCVVYKRTLESTLGSKSDIYNLNAIDYTTFTSTVGHIIRGPREGATMRMNMFLKQSAFRPRFYDNELWNQSALTEALEISDFKVVEKIVRYCLKPVSTRDAGKPPLLEPGYLVIVVGALPIINRVQPRLATRIAQYLSNVPLDEYAPGLREKQRESDKADLFAFAGVEQLSDAESLLAKAL
ncbi:hypothetical protein BC936DRAFT_143104, partial [Jimgerdemannia flammicorona]